MRSNSENQIITSRMQKRGLLPRDIEFFLDARETIREGIMQVDWQKIQPLKPDMVKTVPASSTARYENLQKLGHDHLHQCALIKLNGGRSTTMGGKQPKCMVKVKNDMNFLDIVMNQIIHTNDKFGVEIPLVLMNSFFTDHVTEKIIGKTPLMILNFIQNEFPRVLEDSLLPLDSGTDADWCPAGHGDFYYSLESTGMLDSLLDLGLRYAFISNIDNLSAVISPEILGLIISGEHDFCMEVTRKTKADIKGGSPVIHDTSLSLLEIAQVSEENKKKFQDTDVFPYFNTNNLWIDLRALKQILLEKRLKLPVIANRKSILDRNIIQVETAMGAAMHCFDHPGLIEVKRNRFTPVKTQENLLDFRSDRYIMDVDFQLSENPVKPQS